MLEPVKMFSNFTVNYGMNELVEYNNKKNVFLNDHYRSGWLLKPCGLSLVLPSLLESEHELRPSSCFWISPPAASTFIPLWRSAARVCTQQPQLMLAVKNLVEVRWSTHRSDCAPLTEGSWPAAGCRWDTVLSSWGSKCSRGYGGRLPPCTHAPISGRVCSLETASSEGRGFHHSDPQPHFLRLKDRNKTDDIGR